MGGRGELRRGGGGIGAGGGSVGDHEEGALSADLRLLPHHMRRPWTVMREGRREGEGEKWPRHFLIGIIFWQLNHCGVLF